METRPVMMKNICPPTSLWLLSSALRAASSTSAMAGARHSYWIKSNKAQ
jgi:hypothetical protein